MIKKETRYQKIQVRKSLPFCFYPCTHRSSLIAEENTTFSMIVVSGLLFPSFQDGLPPLIRITGKLASDHANPQIILLNHTIEKGENKETTTKKQKKVKSEKHHNLPKLIKEACMTGDNEIVREKRYHAYT